MDPIAARKMVPNTWNGAEEVDKINQFYARKSGELSDLEIAILKSDIS